MTFRSLATTQCYHMGFFFACDFSTMRIGHRFPRESRFQTFLNKLFSYELDLLG